MIYETYSKPNQGIYGYTFKEDAASKNPLFDLVISDAPASGESMHRDGQKYNWIAEAVVQAASTRASTSPLAPAIDDGSGAPIGIPDSSLPAHGQPLAGGTFVGRYEAGGLLRALVLMPLVIEGAWGPEIDVQGASSIFDGEANTLAMAAAGSEIALEALTMGAYIPSAQEFQVLLAAKAMGWADLDDSSGYWLSTQRSAESALLMGWVDGQQAVEKRKTHPVRAVRNLLIL